MPALLFFGKCPFQHEAALEAFKPAEIGYTVG